MLWRREWSPGWAVRIAAPILMCGAIASCSGSGPNADAVEAMPTPAVTTQINGATDAGTTTSATVRGGAADATTVQPGNEGSSNDSEGYEPPTIDPDNPAVVARPVPNAAVEPITTIAPPPWADGTRTSDRGVSTDVGCAASRSIEDLNAFFAERVGPVLGWDYQHVYPLGGDRSLWLFQDTFLDHSNTVDNLGKARFVHNAALVQDGACFTLMYGGSVGTPAPFEPGDGTKTLQRWFWPMGGEMMANGELGVFWVEMIKDPYDPAPPDGLGWHPQQTYLARYDPATLERRSFSPATNSGVAPIYGYSVASDASYTYLFGNSFEQNLAREGGYWNGNHSATRVYLARVPRGQLDAAPEYRTVVDWSSNPADAQPISQRYFAENPMQMRFLNDQWVAATAVDGYWGDHLAIDVAYDPWGPWFTVAYQPLAPRGADPKMNTYHAHLLPWRDSNGGLQLSVSNNARNMLADAWPNPRRYRPELFGFPYTPPPVTTPPTEPTLPPTTPTTAATTQPPTTQPATTTRPPTTTTRPPTTTTRPPTTTTTTTRPPTTTTTTRPPTTTTTTRPPTTTTTTRPPTTTSTTTRPPTTVSSTTTSTIAS